MMHKFSILFLHVQIEVFVCLFYVLSVLLLHLFPILYLFVAFYKDLKSDDIPSKLQDEDC